MIEAIHKDCGGLILTQQTVIEYGIPSFEDGKILIIETQSAPKSLVLDDIIDSYPETQCEPYCDNCFKVIDFNEITVREK